MTIEVLLENLKKEHKKIEDTIELIMQFNENDKRKSKAKQILNVTKKRKHWMQRPENRARVLKQIKKMHRIKKASKLND